MPQDSRLPLARSQEVEPDGFELDCLVLAIGQDCQDPSQRFCAGEPGCTEFPVSTRVLGRSCTVFHWRRLVATLCGADRAPLGAASAASWAGPAPIVVGGLREAPLPRLRPEDVRRALLVAAQPAQVTALPAAELPGVLHFLLLFGARGELLRQLREALRASPSPALLRVVRAHGYAGAAGGRRRGTLDLEAAVLDGIASLTGQEMLRLRGFAADSAEVHADACLSEEERLEVFNRRARALEDLVRSQRHGRLVSGQLFRDREGKCLSRGVPI